MITIVFVNNIDAQTLSQAKRLRVKKCTPWLSITRYYLLCKDFKTLTVLVLCALAHQNPSF